MEPSCWQKCQLEAAHSVRDKNSSLVQLLTAVEEMTSIEFFYLFLIQEYLRGLVEEILVLSLVREISPTSIKFIITIEKIPPCINSAHGFCVSHVCSLFMKPSSWKRPN